MQKCKYTDCVHVLFTPLIWELKVRLLLGDFRQESNQVFTRWYLLTRIGSIRFFGNLVFILAPHAATSRTHSTGEDQNGGSPSRTPCPGVAYEGWRTKSQKGGRIKDHLPFGKGAHSEKKIYQRKKAARLGNNWLISDRSGGRVFGCPS